jgi:hypothetical protein
MQLTDDDKRRVSEWLYEKCGSLRCFCCGMSQWVTGGAYLNVGYDLHTTKIHYHEGIPMVAIVCPNCGYIMSFSTAVMGILPDLPAEEQTEP